MRLKNRLGTIATALGIEFCIFAFVGLVFLFQFGKAKVELIGKTKAIAETIGEQAGSFFSRRKDGTSDEFFLFLDERLGRKKLFNTFEIAPKFFSVVLKRDIDGAKLPDDLKDDFYPKKGYVVGNHDGIMSVSVPFSLQGHQSEPFGIVKIDSDKQAIMEKVLADNFLFYAAILVVLNNQAFILYMLLRKRKEVVFEKGYLKEHSVGALKIMHKVLGDIIEDHEGSPEPIKKQGDSKKVIPIFELVDKRKK
jgi:hypothetical protein